MVQPSLKICRPSSFARSVHLRTAECLRRLLFSSCPRTQTCTPTRTTLTQPRSLPRSAWTPHTVVVRRLISAILPFPLPAPSSFAPSTFPASSCTLITLVSRPLCRPPPLPRVVVGTHAPLRVDHEWPDPLDPWVYGTNSFEQH